MLAFNAVVGNLLRLEFQDGDRRLSPLTTAPWVGQADEVLPEGLAPVEQWLSGDFLCAPFATSDVEPAPPHGWSANSEWTVTESDSSRIVAELDRTIMGAHLKKVLQLTDSAPLLLQEHYISGGSGGLTLAHHPMVRIRGRGRFSCSPKQLALTPEKPLDEGRNRLQCSISTSDMERIPASNGETVSLADVPIGDAHEDFVTLIEANGCTLGWSAVVRFEEDDVVFFLKDPALLPVTMLWHSNGGRDYAPWNGRHRGVLGIEDGCTAGAASHKAALEPNPVSATGVPTALSLHPTTKHRIPHVIGTIARPGDWSSVLDIRLADNALILTGDTGKERHLPFPSDFFTKEA